MRRSARTHPRLSPAQQQQPITPRARARARPRARNRPRRRTSRPPTVSSTYPSSHISPKHLSPSVLRTPPRTAAPRNSARARVVFRSISSHVHAMPPDPSSPVQHASPRPPNRPPEPPCTTSIPPTVAAPCAALGVGTSPPHVNPSSPSHGSKTCNSFVAPLSFTHAPASRAGFGSSRPRPSTPPTPPSSSVAPPGRRSSSLIPSQRRHRVPAPRAGAGFVERERRARVPIFRAPVRARLARSRARRRTARRGSRAMRAGRARGVARTRARV